MAAFTTLFLFAALVRQGSAQGSWVVTFEDEFLGTELNTSSWTASNYSSVVSQYDGHDALFVADMVSVNNGILSITTAWAPQEFNGVHYNMTSGWIDTQQKVNQSRGRFEASVKMPNAGAVGAWPAWCVPMLAGFISLRNTRAVAILFSPWFLWCRWLLPEGQCWPISGEIDIVEYWVGQGHNQHSRTENPAQMSSSYQWVVYALMP
jgi:beta-glucanase (GH16 family)